MHNDVSVHIAFYGVNFLNRWQGDYAVSYTELIKDV